MSGKLILTITLGLIIHPGLIVQDKCFGQQARRNTAAYDKAGPYSIDNEPPFEKRERMAGEIRSFLWEHWKERRLGVLRAVFFSIEGDHTSSKFFVEPDSSGHWRITVVSQTVISALLPKGRKPRRENTDDEYDLIDRVDAKGDSSSPSISEEERRSPETYRLRLRNSRTNSVLIF
jgi:hypothetical protein